MKQYRNETATRWLRFADGQEVGPGETFRRDYDPEQEWHHKVAGIIVEVPDEVPTTPTPSTKRSSSPRVKPSATAEDVNE